MFYRIYEVALRGQGSYRSSDQTLRIHHRSSPDPSLNADERSIRSRLGRDRFRSNRLTRLTATDLTEIQDAVQRTAATKRRQRRWRRRRRGERGRKVRETRRHSRSLNSSHHLNQGKSDRVGASGSKGAVGRAGDGDGDGADVRGCPFPFSGRASFELPASGKLSSALFLRRGRRSGARRRALSRNL